MTIRYQALSWDFSRHEPARVDRAAQQLANDIKSIMPNSGGPTAAQTVCPILNRNATTWVCRMPNSSAWAATSRPR